MQSTLDMTALVTPSQASVASEVGGELVILNLSDGVYYGLSGVGVRVWELLAEPRSVGAILDVILAEYEVTPEQGLRDLTNLLAELGDYGLVEISDGAGS